ncbi:dTDP-4-dehydrorhamnose reductase [Serinibacter arcticus]|uniref:dTDP-4-dehydrorhamnose reductase n=1 Tax=Serinibacter arcticus TaxID=1655435 RepID=A0A2U1ZYT0_9MICO|nr:dTDP-4-dehydrorhamnose reductase [Serinibacter arcticus]PWD52124.1 dTDP-4-dehydrorhamnose reductase [Serinibacter arcticus]
MRVLVTGAAGMLGQDLCARLEADHDVVAADRDTLDITSLADVTEKVRGYDAVVNCAAWTAVDDAETREADAFLLNAVGPHLLSRAATASGARLVQISTDYVFDGGATEPYQADDPVRPASAYGRTKAAGEWAVLQGDALVVRTAWLYGAGGPNFPRTMARLASERDQLTVVSDQIGQPTWTVDVAEIVTQLLETGAPRGTYHATSSGRASWFEFAQTVVETLGKDPAMVTPVTSAEFVRPAPRPASSVLGHDSLVAAGLAPIGDWSERWHVAAPVVLG